MKITDKIVTQVEQPSMTNVVWHNPDTNELKIYSKNCWEVVGGSPGGSNVTPISNGYPIVNVYNNVTMGGEQQALCVINAESNTYYRMSQPNSEILMQFNPFEYAQVSGKYLMFSFDDLGDETFMQFNQLSSYIGFIQTANTDIDTKQEYPYKLINPTAQTEDIVILLANDLTESNNTVAYIPEFSDQPIPINNIQIKQTDEYYLIEMYPCICKEVDNDSTEYEHKYEVVSSAFNMESPDSVVYLYTYQENNQTIGVVSMDIYTLTLPISKFKSEQVIDTVNEYVFEITTPISIITPANFKWNNNTIPDLQTPGLFTLSIVNGVGCYSFVPQ